MKRIVIAFIIFSLCLGMFACSKSEDQLIRDHADSILNSIKNFDLQTLYKLTENNEDSGADRENFKLIIEEFENPENVESEFANKAMRSMFAILDWEFIDHKFNEDQTEASLNYKLLTPKLDQKKIIEIMEEIQTRHPDLEEVLAGMQAKGLNDEISKRAFMDELWPIIDEFFQALAKLEKQEIPLEFVYSKKDNKWNLLNFEAILENTFYRAFRGMGLFNSLW